MPAIFPYGIGAILWGLWFVISYRDGKKTLAMLSTCMLVAVFTFLTLDAEIETGKSQVAVAISCWPREYKKPSGCKLRREDGIFESTPVPEWVRPGDRVVLVELKTKITGRQLYKYAGPYAANK